MKEYNVSSLELMPIIKEQINKRDVTLLINGNSMLPFYKNKKTHVTLTKHKQLKKYDVILYKYNNKYIIHRIIKIKDNVITCQGDGLITKEVIDIKDVIAVVKSHKINNKVIDKSNKVYILKVRLWHLLRIFRRALLKFVRR